MKAIKVNKKLLDRSPEQLIIDLSQINCQKDDYSIRFITTSLDHLPKFTLKDYKKAPSLLGKKIPLDEIFSLLKDAYQGKLNDYLQEILNTAEIELLINKTSPDNPQSTRQLEIKIRLAATVIDKYADLITMAIGDKTTKIEDEVIDHATESLKKLNEQLNGINLLLLISQVRTDCMQLIEQYQPGCLSFFYTDNTIKNLKTMEFILSNLMQEGFTTAEIMGGVLQVNSQIQAVFGSNQTGKSISRSFNELFFQSNFNINDQKNNQQMIQAYIHRAKQLEVEWPKPFIIIQSKTHEIAHLVDDKTALLRI